MKRPFYGMFRMRTAAPAWRGVLRHCGIAAVAAITLLPATGCRTTAPEDSPPPSIQPPDQTGKAEFDAFARTCGPELIEAIQTGNYHQFITHFATGFNSAEREKNFPAMCRKIGKIVKGEYIGHLDREILQTYLWKVTVEQTVKAGNGESRTATFDRLLQFTLVKNGGKFQVVEFQFN